MGHKKEETKNKGALISSNSSNGKSKRVRRMILSKFSRASSIIRVGPNPKRKYSWSLVAFACCIKPETIASLDKNPRKPMPLGKAGSVPSICDVDNSAVHSEGNNLAVSTLSQPLDNADDRSPSPSSEFVNHAVFNVVYLGPPSNDPFKEGLLLWSQTREQWVGEKKKTSEGLRFRDPKLSPDATYESLLGSNKPFAEPVPLAEMVDFLVDVWEQEGMYDIKNALLQ